MPVFPLVLLAGAALAFIFAARSKPQATGTNPYLQSQYGRAAGAEAGERGHEAAQRYSGDTYAAPFIDFAGNGQQIVGNAPPINFLEKVQQFLGGLGQLGTEVPLSNHAAPIPSATSQTVTPSTPIVGPTLPGSGSTPTNQGYATGGARFAGSTVAIS